MNAPDERARTVRQWVENAEQDLSAAKRSLTPIENCPSGPVCFLAQQCAEKYLKALLLWHSVEFPRTHDLRLVAQLIPSDVTLRLEVAEILPLNRYAVEARYPGDWEPIALEEAHEAVALAEKVRAAVRRLLPADAL